MEVGKRHRVSPEYAYMERSSRMRLTGTVVWVHPKKRFAVLEFSSRSGAVRECFFPEQLNNGR